MMDYSGAKVADMPMCNPTPNKQSIKENLLDTNKCLRECVLILMDMREQICGHGGEPEKLPEPQCLIDEVMCCNAQSHKLLDVIREIQVVVM